VPLFVRSGRDERFVLQERAIERRDLVALATRRIAAFIASTVTPFTRAFSTPRRERRSIVVAGGIPTF
jgi:hypothetical protein